MDALLTRAAAPPPSTRHARNAVCEQAAARAQMRRQIARLEQRLTALVIELGHDVSEPDRTGGPRLMALEELELRRDRLARLVARAQPRLHRRQRSQAQARELLEAMLADPARHRFARVSRADLGVPGCGSYEVRPRLGLIGMLAGWWEVKLSSGCPLSRDAT